MRLSKKSARILAASACLAIAVSCTGCKSSEVKNTEKLIKNIGEVTLDSGEAIHAASDAYEELGDQQSKVGNAKTLQEAEHSYESLLKFEASPIVVAISEIPQPVTEECEEAVEKAEELYNSASDDIKSVVSNADVLFAARSVLDDANVQKAIDAINKIGTVTINSQDAIDAANSAYQSVSEDRRAEVTNYDVLASAMSEINSIKKDAAEAAGKAAVSRLNKRKDDVEGITWYEPSCYPKYSNSRCFVLPYIGEQNGSYWLRCKVDYVNSDWVFYTSVIFNVDGVKRDTINFDYNEVTRDTVLGGNLYEMADFSPSSSQIQLLKDIANSEKTIIRFQGSDYYYDFTVSSKDKQGIKDVLAAYDYLK